MTFEQIMAIPISVLAVAITGLMVVMIVKYPKYLNTPERFGCGLMGGSSFLIIAPVMDFGNIGTPFDLWPSVLFRLGIVFFGVGWLWRKQKHEINNRIQERRARRHLEKRGIDVDKALAKRNQK